MNIKENYQQYVSRYAAEVAALKRKNTGFITGELLAFGGILAFLICYFAVDGDTQNYLLGAVLCLSLGAYFRLADAAGLPGKSWNNAVGLMGVYFCTVAAFAGTFNLFFTAAAIWLAGTYAGITETEAK